MSVFRRKPRPTPSEAPTNPSDIKPDPSRVGGVAEAPFMRLPDPATLFLMRADRLRAVAEGHTLGDYLRFLSTVVDAQAAAVIALPDPPALDPDQFALRTDHAMPPIAVDQVRGSIEFSATLDWLLDHVALDSAPEAARGAAAAVRAMPQAARFDVAADVFEGAYVVDKIAETLFVAAALQVHLARLAVQLDAAIVKPASEGSCPVCGGAPVSSLVVGWTPASKARYCACSLCGTLWNHVRIRCTACGATDGMAYYTVEGDEGGVGVETCSTCRSYVKHMQQHEHPRLDPVADDVASYALDLLARDEGFHRSGLNPLFLTG